MRAIIKLSVIDVLTIFLFTFGGIMNLANSVTSFSNGLTKEALSSFITFMLTALIVLLIVQAGSNRAFVDTLIEVIDELKDELKKNK